MDAFGAKMCVKAVARVPASPTGRVVKKLYAPRTLHAAVLRMPPAAAV